MLRYPFSKNTRLINMKFVMRRLALGFSIGLGLGFGCDIRCATFNEWNLGQCEKLPPCASHQAVREMIECRGHDTM